MRVAVPEDVGLARVAAARARLALTLSCLGHAYAHLFQPIFFVIALPLEAAWGLSHGDVIALILVGNILYGVVAPLAGWLGDRWSMTGMMILFFFGTGSGMIATGLAQSPAQMMVALAATGLFGAIYHPVGIAWLVRNAGALGKALGINGVFGGIGPAAAALSAGLLTDHFGWRSAFIVPGLLVVLTGVAVAALAVSGRLVEHKADRVERPPPPQDRVVRTFILLAGTMLCTSLIYQATQAALPKLFSERIGNAPAAGITEISMLVAAVYLGAGACQMISGHLADRFSMRSIYAAAFVLQVPLLLLLADAGGALVAAAALFAVAGNVGALPAETGLLAKLTPARWRGFAFGLKFIVAFGIAGLGVKLEATLYDATGGFFWLFVVLGAVAAAGALGTLLLPRDQRHPVPAPAE